MKKAWLMVRGFTRGDWILTAACFWLATGSVSPAQTTTGNGVSDRTQQLLEAVHAGETNKVAELFNKGADINAKNDFGTTALMAAVMAGDANMLKFLLDGGADVNARDNQGFTALMNSATPAIDPATGLASPVNSTHQMLEEKIHRLLLNHGADLGAKDDEYGDTVLIHMALLNLTNTVGLLLDRGADINAKNNAGKTALCDVVGICSPEDMFRTNVIKLLLARGADFNEPGKDGETPLGIAKRTGTKPVARLLQLAGATALSVADSYFNPLVASRTNTDTAGYVTNELLLEPFTLTNSSGDVFTNAVLARLMPNKFFYKTAEGAMGVLPLAALSEELRDKFGYDAERAKAADDFEQKKKVRQSQPAPPPPQEFASQPVNVPGQNPITPSNINAGIRAYAEKEFPDDYTMQKFVIEKQTEAYNWVVSSVSTAGVPQDVYLRIKAKAADEFPGDYVMQQFVITKQAKAYTDLH